MSAAKEGQRVHNVLAIVSQSVRLAVITVDAFGLDASDVKNLPDAERKALASQVALNTANALRFPYPEPMTPEQFIDLLQSFANVAHIVDSLVQHLHSATLEHFVPTADEMLAPDEPTPSAPDNKHPDDVDCRRRGCRNRATRFSQNGDHGDPTQRCDEHANELTQHMEEFHDEKIAWSEIH